MKNIAQLMMLCAFLLLSQAMQAQKYYVVTNAEAAQANGIYEKTEILEIHEKDFYTYEGPLPDKKFSITPVEYQFPIYQWKIVNKSNQEVLFFTTTTTSPNPPEAEWVSNQFKEIPVTTGPMTLKEAEVLMKN